MQQKQDIVQQKGLFLTQLYIKNNILLLRKGES